MGKVRESPVSLSSMLARFSEHWAPKKIAEINDYDVKIVKLQGEFTWHRHADTDEFFLVIEPRGVVNTGDAGGDFTVGLADLTE